MCHAGSAPGMSEVRAEVILRVNNSDLLFTRMIIWNYIFHDRKFIKY